MEKLVRVVIVDDEEPARVNLRYALANFSNWIVVAECDCAQAAIQKLAAEHVDVVFIDVQMPGEDGLSLARNLCGLDYPPLMVFVTAYGQYAIQAFDVHAVDYLLKPIDDTRLQTTVEHVENLIQIRQRSSYVDSVLRSIDEVSEGPAGAKSRQLERLCIRSVGKIETVQLSEVLWMASAGNYVELHLSVRSVLYRAALTNLEARLDSKVFLRVHRTVIVRREQLVGYQVLSPSVYAAQLACGATVPVSKRYVDEVRALLE